MLVVEGAQLFEEGELEDVVGLDGDHDEVVPPELLPERVVGDAQRVVVVEEALRGGVELDPGQLRAQHRHHGDDEEDDEPRAAVGQPSPGGQ